MTQRDVQQPAGAGSAGETPGLEAQLERLAAFLESLRREGATVMERERRLLGELAAAQGRQAQLAGQYEAIQSQQGQLAAEKTALQNQQAQLASQNATLKGQQAQFAAEKAALQSQQAQLAAEKTALQSQQAKLTAQNEALRRECESLGEALAAAREAVAIAQSVPTVTNGNNGGDAGRPTERIGDLGSEGDAGRPEVAAERRARLARRARAIRAQLATRRQEVIQGLELLRVRREHMEQIRRLLEKRELVMSQRMATHSAIKTVAAVGIFVTLVLGVTFWGVYRFVSPVYRGEAVVQVVPPASVGAAQLPGWLARQANAVRTDQEMLKAAWKKMHEDGYTAHATEDLWLAAVPAEMDVKLEPASRTVAVQFEGASAEGVATEANAVAGAYVEKLQRSQKPEASSQKDGGGAVVVAKAAVPTAAVRDRRMSLALSVTAGLLTVSLVAVMLLRHKIARELRAIDHMAEPDDLAGVGDEVPVVG